MITELRMKGFKSFIDNTIALSPLTVLMGINSSGKSSVIQAIRLLENVNEGRPLILDGHGSFDEMISSYTKGDLIITAKLDTNEEAKIEYISNKCSTKKIENCPQAIFIGAHRFGTEATIPVIQSKLKIGERGENMFRFLQTYADEVLDSRLKVDTAEGVTLEYLVKGWLKKISPGVKFDYKIESKADVSYGTYNGYRSSNVGFGLSYTLPVIIGLLAGVLFRGTTIVMVENPEAHLHPRAQTEMAKLIALSVECGAQVILETHSDHLYDGLRIYVRKHLAFLQQISTYWFELNEEANTIVQPIKLGERGVLEGKIPMGFLDQFEINASELLF